MASKNNITPVEITSDSSSGSSIDPTYLPYGQDLMDGQNESELLPTQDLEYSLTPKEQYRSQSRLQAKKASKSVSVSSMDMFQSEPSTSTKYSTQNITILDTLDLVDANETAAFDFPPEKKAKLAIEDPETSQTQWTQSSEDQVHGQSYQDPATSRTQSSQSQEPTTSQRYTGNLTARSLRYISEELSFMADKLTPSKIEAMYALHCAKYLYEYLNNKDPHNEVTRKLRREIIEKRCLEKPILDL